MKSFPYLSTHDWLVYYEEKNPDKKDPNSSLAYQSALIRYMIDLNEEAEHPVAALHFYPVLEPTILLGGKDSRLPNVMEANQYLLDQGYQITLRPHGGLAVVNDPGILNVGMASDTRNFSLSIDEAYEQMVHLIGLAFEKYGLSVEAYEVPDSYCPGKYDLVVNGLKIGGIAQRRFKTGVTTAAYLSVGGDQDARGQLIAHYYNLGQADESYPKVNPASMTTLSDLTGLNLTLEDIEQDIVEVLEKYARVEDGDLEAPALLPHYKQALKQTQGRSASMNPNLHSD